MTKQSRLRVQGAKRGRRIILCAALVAVAGLAGWYLEQRHGLLTSCQHALASISKKLTPKSSRRGEFYDRNLKQIAINKERVSVYIRTQELKSVTETVMELAPILSLDEETLKGQLESGALRIWIAEDISQDQEIALKAKRLPGVYLQREQKRVYPNKSQAAHLIGYVENGIGLAGVESYYDRIMATGRPGKEKVRFNAPQDLVLTLDLKIQDVLDGLVEEIRKFHKAKKVLAYVMDSNTGEVIGGAQLPGFDLNAFTQYPREVLEDQFVAPILLPDKFRAFLRDAALLQDQAEAAGASIPWSLRPVEKTSGKQVQLWQWLGLNETAATDFHSQSGEVAQSDQHPLLPSQPSLDMVPEQSTPLNLLTAFAVLLNQGRVIKPFVVQKSLDVESGAEVTLADNEGERAGRAAQGRRFFDLEGLFASQARQGEGGSLFFRDRMLSAKTSAGLNKVQATEVLLVKIPSGGNEMTLLVTAVYDPAEPKAKNATMQTSIEELVEEKVERIAILQEVAKTVADVVEPELHDEGYYQQQNRNSNRVKASGNKARGAHAAIMPDLRGMSLRKSLRQLQGVNVKINIQGTGKVVMQKPAPGTNLAGGAECTLVLQKVEDLTLEKLSKGSAIR
jgi:cell division protein FtsI (penicillin-binding protein 3)